MSRKAIVRRIRPLGAERRCLARNEQNERFPGEKSYKQALRELKLPSMLKYITKQMDMAVNKKEKDNIFTNEEVDRYIASLQVVADLITSNENVRGFCTLGERIKEYIEALNLVKETLLSENKDDSFGRVRTFFVYATIALENNETYKQVCR
ncbi:MAG: hypothetical protein WCW27_06435 [Patescibacteria group bacterium]|jgi:hypothetical protein